MREPRRLLFAGVIFLLVGAGGWYVLIAGPRDLWARYPALAAWLHPYVLGLDAILALAAGVGFSLAGLLHLFVHRTEQ